MEKGKIRSWFCKSKEIQGKKQFKEIQGNFLIIQGNQGIQGRVGPLEFMLICSLRFVRLFSLTKLRLHIIIQAYQTSHISNENRFSDFPELRA